MLRTSLAVSLSAISSINAAADEGMWLPNALPLAQMKAAYGFEPSAGWADHLQRSAVRFSTGGSGSLVSAQGLVMTNHHVGSDMLAKLSTPTRDLLETGFLARSRADELGEGEIFRPPLQRSALNDRLWSCLRLLAVGLKGELRVEALLGLLLKVILVPLAAEVIAILDGLGHRIG